MNCVLVLALLCAAALLFGCSTAFSQQYRFAAAESVTTLPLLALMLVAAIGMRPRLNEVR